MNNETWVPSIKSYWRDLTDFVFSLREDGEEITLNLNGEHSLYVRINSSQVRQTTGVDQKALEVVFQRDRRRVSLQFDLSMDQASDKNLLERILAQARAETAAIPEDPFVVSFKNNGRSEQDFSGQFPPLDEILRNLTEETKGSDFTGFLAMGPVIRANRNHLGQDHWFSSNQFFIDYSLFTVNVDGENKAVKSNYSGRKWNSTEFQKNYKHAFDQLQKLKKANHSLKPGEYRTYLAPGAVSELVHMLSWNGLSLGAYKKGTSAFAQLYEGKQKLSPLFSVRENFELGLSPAFNSLGEVAPAVLPLVEGGELKNFLVSTRTSQEAGVPSNFSDINGWGQEYMRSPEVMPGTLDDSDVLKKLGTGLYLSQLHYCNWSHVLSARVTGMTRYACFWVEGGEIVAPIKDLRFDDTLFRVFGSSLEALTSHSVVEPVIDTYWQRRIGGSRLPGALLSGFQMVL